MSAYLVSPSLISSILTHFAVGADGKCDGQPFTDMGHDLRDAEGLQALGADLWALNHESLHQRYGDDAKPKKAFVYKKDKVVKDRVQIIKHIRCLMYQCSEGSVPQTSLYKALALTANRIAFSYVSDLPSYTAADW